MLPDRESAAAPAWLSQQPQIAIVARDWGGAYALAAATALPYAIQVADRWDLMENASRAFLDAIRKSMRQIRSGIGAMTINPDLLRAAERLQYQGYLRREEANAAVFALAKDGVAIKEIVRRTGHSRGLVLQILRRQRSDGAPNRSAHTLSPIPSARHQEVDDDLARHAIQGRDIHVTAVETAVPALIEAREIIVAFHLMIRCKAEGDLCA